MIKSVTVTNHLGESLVLELTRPDLSGFIVKEIDGLGPVKANINTTKRATADGTAYNSAYLNQRDITFQLQFYTTGAESIEDIRHRSYKYFPLKKQVTIRVETDNRISEATGYVESNEPNIFSSVEGCTVVVACPDPYFYSHETNETIFYGVEPTFEFPLFNNSSTEALLQMGVVKNKTEENVFNSGDAEVGLSIILHATGDVTNVTIYNLDTREQMVLDTSKIPENSILEGDTITINTTLGNKSISLLRQGEMINILNCVSKNSKWFTLHKGDNPFAYKAESGAEHLQFRMENKVAYIGV